MDAEDIVQIYIHSKSSDATPFPKLCGFKRVAIPAGSEEEIEISICDSAFTVVNDEGEVISGGNEFTFYAGTCQPDPLSEKLSGTSCVSVSVVK